MQGFRKTIMQIFAILTAFAAVGVAFFVIYKNWTQIASFFTDRCPHLHSKAMRKEYADYVD